MTPKQIALKALDQLKGDITLVFTQSEKKKQWNRIIYFHAPVVVPLQCAGLIWQPSTTMATKQNQA